MGVLAMALAILLLFWLPAAAAQVPRVILWGFFANFFVLGWLGACPMEAPFPVLGGCNALIYFGGWLAVWGGRKQRKIN